MIDADEIREIVIDSFYPGIQPGDEIPENALKIQGIMRTFVFNPERLETHRAQVVAIIDQLHTEFLAEDEGGGGGWSFLNLCMTKDDMQWGEHMNCEDLIVIATGLGLCEYSMPRQFWSALPGGMPYVVFRKEKKA